MTTPHVVVTGAGGFVGRSLVRGFAALGWQVSGVDRAFDAGWAAGLDSVAQVEADLAAGMPGGLPPPHLVVHGAAITADPSTLGWTRAAHLAANTRPLLAALEYAAATRPAAFVYLSSSGVFAPEDGRGALAVTDVPTGQSAYAVAKRLGERATLEGLDGLVPAHVVRLGYLYGPDEWARPTRPHVSPVARWLATARAGRALEVRDDDPARDWTWTLDLAPALARLVFDGAASRVVHLASPAVVRDSAMAARIARHFPGVTCVLTPAPAPAKPPMRACDPECLRGFAWTDADTGVAALAAEVPV